MSDYENFEIVVSLDDEDLMSTAFAYGSKTDRDDNSTNCMHSCSDTCCC
jgi:hypothetical protein